MTWPDFWGSCRFFKRYPKILGGSKTPVNISYCGQALARLLQDDYKDLGHDNEEKVNPLSTFAQQFLCVFFSKYFHLYFNSLLAHARKKQRKKGVQTIWCCFFSTSPLLSILILFVPSSVNTVLLVPHIAAVCSGHIDDVDAWDSSRNEHGQCWSNGERNFFLRLFAVCIAH